MVGGLQQVLSKMVYFGGEEQDWVRVCLSFWIQERKAHVYAMDGETLDAWMYFARSSAQKRSTIPDLGLNVYMGEKKSHTASQGPAMSVGDVKNHFYHNKGMTHLSKVKNEKLAELVLCIETWHNW